MIKRKKTKLAHKVIGVYLFGHSMIAVSILAITGIGLKIMQQNLIQTYKVNAHQHMEYFDEELLSLQRLLIYTMQNKSILILANQYEQLSNYNRISWQKQAKEDLLTIYGQYKWIDDIGIYLSQYNLWITAVNWFRPDEKISTLDKEEGMYFLGDSLYLIETYKNKQEVIKAYIKLSRQELINLMRKMKFNEEAYIEIYFNGNQLKNLSDSELEKQDLYHEISVKSKLYPIEFRVYVNNALLDFRNSFYILSLFSLILFIFITIKFSRYLNSAIHRPLQNVVDYIDHINLNNFEEEIPHEGMDEFEYVTESFNKTKNLLEQYIKKNYEQEINMKQMELSHLQGQVKPHFLYNCFFNISSMCKIYDIEKIEEMTQGLAKYYRYITRTNHNVVSLEEEYEHMKNYIGIQQIRFGDRVEVYLDTLPEVFSAITVPRLILQPIVENAYKYVFEKVESGGKLYIKINQAREFLLIKVEDNGNFIQSKEISDLMQKIKDAKDPITGLVNIKKRLNYINEKNDIQIIKGDLGGVTVIVKIFIKD